MDNSTKRQSNRGRRRPVNFMLREEDCDGLISFLEALPYGAESKLMRAVLIDWFQEQQAKHGDNASAAANELIQKYEIRFLQQKHGIQFAGAEHQPKKELRQPVPAIAKPQPEPAPAPVESGRTEASVERMEVEPNAAPATVDLASVLRPAPALSVQHGMPLGPSHVSGEVNVDDILGL